MGGRPAVAARAATCATLARMADASAAVGLVLLAVDPATGLARGPLIGGVLAALLSAPHTLGPVVAHVLDRTRHAGPVLAGFFAAYAVMLGIAALTVGRAPLVLAMVATVGAGLCGPLLTGGLSSRFASWIEAGAARRAEALDSATYGAAGILGPVAVTASAATVGTRTAVLAVAAVAAAAAVLAVTLPAAGEAHASGDPAMRLTAVLAVMWRSLPLRRTTLGTCLAEMAAGALPVAAALLAARLGHPERDVGVMITAFGVGALAGSVIVAVRPPRAEPARQLPVYAAVIAVAYAVAGCAPGFGVALAAFAVAGLADGPLLAATLAVRSRYAPRAARARVFVTGAGLKIGASSLGAALAGVAAPLGGRTLLVLSAVLAACGAVTMIGRRAAPGPTAG